MKNNKLTFISAVVGVTLPLAVSCSNAIENPNIVIIYADDIGIGDLECYGTGIVPTPNVNSLAERGTLFTNSHATSATSTPSRFGLLTGVYPWRQKGTNIAAGDAAMIIKPNRYTIADAAKKAGYVTGAVGKWHLGLGDETGKQDWNGSITPNLKDIGFDYSFIMAATGDRVPCVYIENNAVYNWDSIAPIEVSYDKAFEGEPTGAKNPELLKLHPSHGHDQAVVNGISRIGYMKGGGKALWRDEDIADCITKKAVQFIENNSDEPFFLYFGTNDIHVPRAPNERFVGESGLGARGDAILQFDYSVGQILEVLERMGIAENTIVILSSDNGPVIDDGYQDQAVELLGEHRPMGDYRGGKYSAFEAGTRVPMIVRWDGKVKAKYVSDAAFSHIDFSATLNGIMGVEVVESANLDSRDAILTLIGEDQKGRDYIIKQNAHSTLSVLSQGWKYIPASDALTYNALTNTEMGNTPEDKLYYLEQDIAEQNNLAGRNPEIVEKMKAILSKEYAKGVEIIIPKGSMSHQ